MKKQWRWWRGKIWITGVLSACAGLLILSVPFRGHSGASVSLNSATIPGGSNYLCSVKRATVPWYVRSRQWQADIRSLAAVLRYLSDSDLLAQTNEISARAGDV